MKSAIGCTSTQLMQRIGSPTSVMDNGKSVRVFIYDYSYNVSKTKSKGFATPLSGGNAVQPNIDYLETRSSTTVQNVVTKKIEYFIDSEDHVFYWYAVGFPSYRIKRYTKTELAQADSSLFAKPKDLN